MASSFVGQGLERWFGERLEEPARSWYREALVAARRSGPEDDAFLVPWSGCGRRLGRGSLTVSEADAGRLAEAGAPFLPRGWGADELGRGLLLLAALEARSGALAVRVTDELYRKGEMREQQAILRVLAFLPEPAAQAPLAAEAVRNNVVSVLEALACDNPFPAAHMSELAFNQMVMKAVFNGLPLARVQGLAARSGPELRRMVSGYASERRAAGRPVPADLVLVEPTLSSSES